MKYDVSERPWNAKMLSKCLESFTGNSITLLTYRNYWQRLRLLAWNLTSTSVVFLTPLIARFMGPTWDPSGANRTQVGPMLAPWTFLSGSLWPSDIIWHYKLKTLCFLFLVIAFHIQTSYSQYLSQSCLISEVQGNIAECNFTKNTDDFVYIYEFKHVCTMASIFG